MLDNQTAGGIPRYMLRRGGKVRPREGLDVDAMLSAVKDTFNFSAVPTGPKRQGGGLEFDNGVLREGSTSIVITNITIYNDGLSVNVPSNTRNAEIVLQKLLALAHSLGVREPVTPPLHYYLSQIIADFESSLDTLIPSSILQKIGKAVGVEEQAQFSAIGVNFDKTKLRGRVAPINPTTFNIQRRIDVPYEQNRYFSQANMTTENHIELLTEFEKLAAKAK
jgi:hypothetical protein